MRQTIIAAAAALSAFAGVAEAEGKRVTVVELYTSQGCSSCPPADALFSEVAARDGVIGLALHVDYWDYIGWADTFADPTFTKRQKAYAVAAGERMVYTPQIIVNGATSIVGTDASALASALVPAGGASAPDLKLSRSGNRLKVSATTSAPLPKGSFVQLVRYIPAASVTIERGENAGRRLTYTNIVTSWKRVGEWDGSKPLSLTLDAPGDQPAVVIIQSPGPGAIFVAAVAE
ncbi:DUF1223 domain-containing protein [Frigidibacter sp. RF13]|uniref:DUF1223 domain-containing protein n=1 Tax=Frigidibacter sp. RF13 TaxID=2997340 RepID=UPI00226EA968|nr:DUF1223 domain-containing protein [Frigidibacter sp. RF13]MCY1125884.1 DUF1223 domain-containing protein [Frigidibacter sp. RF13]